jgi:esterase/lipase superfamily enzyme
MNISSALGLQKKDASHVCQSARSQSLTLSKVPQSATSKRAVLLNGKGKVVKVGRLTSSLPKPHLRSSGVSLRRSRAGTTQAQRKRAGHRFSTSLTRGIRASKPKSGKALTRSQSNGFQIVPVFFATDRLPKSQNNKDCSFSNQRSDSGDLGTGICHVSIPTRHEMGHLESPSWLRFWRFESRADPKKHIVLLQSRVVGAKDFYRRIAERTRASKRKEAFVFVHGYDVSFNDAARRTAQIAHDLKFEGAPILYSWPSRASLRLYPADEATIDWSQHNFEKFLVKLAAKSGASLIHVIAHSMGNRLAMRALNSIIARKAIANDNLFRQIVLTAPDIDAGEFVNLAEAINPSVERVTLYASSRDKALKASRKFHAAPRAGESGKHILITDGVDTVDASTVDTSFLAHSYFSTRRSVLSDIFYLITQGHPPQQRHGLESRIHKKGVYWAFSK